MEATEEVKSLAALDGAASRTPGYLGSWAGFPDTGGCGAAMASGDQLV